MPQEDAKKERPLHEQRLIATASNAADVQHDAMPNWAALIVEGIEEVLFSVDSEWRFTYLNAQASLIWGMPREALLGKVMWEAFPSLGGSSFEHLRQQRAHLKILCMSGYTDRAVLRHGILRQYNAFLQRPFTPEALLRRISDVLNAPPGQA